MKYPRWFERWWINHKEDYELSIRDYYKVKNLCWKAVQRERSRKRVGGKHEK